MGFSFVVSAGPVVHPLLRKIWRRVAEKFAKQAERPVAAVTTEEGEASSDERATYPLTARDSRVAADRQIADPIARSHKRERP